MHEPLAYLIEPEDAGALRAVMDRLYSGVVLDYDGRRDLARLIERVLNNAQPVNA